MARSGRSYRRTPTMLWTPHYPDASMRNAEIAAALDELAVLYELDGANRFRVLAYKDAAKLIRDCPQSVEELALAGRATELDGIGDTLQTKIVALLDRGRDPRGGEAQAEVPGNARRGHPAARDRRQDRAQDVRRARRHVARRASRRCRAAAAARRQGARREGRGERARRDRQDRGRGPRRAPAALGRARGRRAARRGPARAPGLRAGRDGGLGAALGRDLQGHRHRRHCRATPRRWSRPCSSTSSPPSGAARARAAASIRTHNGIGIDLRIVPPAEFGNLLQHFTGSKEHNVKLRERAVRMGLSVSEHGIKQVSSGDVETFEDRGRASTAVSASPTSSPSCAREWTSSRSPTPSSTASCPSSSSSATSAVTCTAHDALRRQGGAHRHGRDGEVDGLLVHRRSPTTRRRTASATTYSPTRCSSGSRRSASSTRRPGRRG